MKARVGEFELIRRALEQDARIRAARRASGMAGERPAGGQVIESAGNDCAVIAGRAIALSVDASIEGVHFRREWMTPEQTGYRAAAAALSDLAPSAARPVGLFVTLAVRPADVPDYALGVMAGISEAADTAGAVLLGGDISRSDGPVMIDVTVAGEVDRVITRRDAQPGDDVFVTGTLGAAAAAVRAWNAGLAPSPAAVAAFTRPAPRIAGARWLAERSLIHAAIDLSDGLAGDAGHLASDSGVRIVLEEAIIPVATAAREIAGDDAAALALALGGGEDYELCFTGAPAAVEREAAAFEALFGVRLTRVGRVTEGNGIGLLGRDGSERALDVAGYSHFESKEESS